jgi:hypothetical protein
MATITTFGEEGVSKEVQALGFYAEKVFLTCPKVRTVRNCPIDEDAIEARLASTRRGVPPLPHWMMSPAGFWQPPPPPHFDDIVHRTIFLCPDLPSRGARPPQTPNLSLSLSLWIWQALNFPYASAL